MNRVLSTIDLRETKTDREAFSKLPRLPVRVILDGVRGGYNIGAIIRLVDAMMLERLIVCGLPVEEVQGHKRRLSQAAQGTQHWVPWEHHASAVVSVAEARQAGYQIAAIELTSISIRPEAFEPKFPLCLVIGGERTGVSAAIVRDADVCLALPMRGMANSMNLATAAAIVFHEVCKHHRD